MGEKKEEIIKKLREKESNYQRKKEKLEKKLKSFSSVAKEIERLNIIYRSNLEARVKIELKIASVFSNEPITFRNGASHNIKPVFYKKQESLKLRNGYNDSSSIAWKYFWELCNKNKVCIKLRKEAKKINQKIDSVPKRKQFEKVKEELRCVNMSLSFSKEQIEDAKTSKGFLIQWGKDVKRIERNKIEAEESKIKSEKLEKFIKEFVNKELIRKVYGRKK